MWNVSYWPFRPSLYNTGTKKECTRKETVSIWHFSDGRNSLLQAQTVFVISECEGRALMKLKDCLECLPTLTIDFPLSGHQHNMCYTRIIVFKHCTLNYSLLSDWSFPCLKPFPDKNSDYFGKKLPTAKPSCKNILMCVILFSLKLKTTVYIFNEIQLIGMQTVISRDFNNHLVVCVKLILD